MSDEFEIAARKKAASILQLQRGKNIGLSLKRFSSWSFIQGALWAFDYFKSKELERAQAECDWNLTRNDDVLMPPHKRD